MVGAHCFCWEREREREVCAWRGCEIPRCWARAAPCLRGWMFLHRWILFCFCLWIGIIDGGSFPFIIFLLPFFYVQKLQSCCVCVSRIYESGLFNSFFLFPRLISA